MSMGSIILNLKNHIIEVMNLTDNNEDISALIGVLETTTHDAYDKRETIKESEP